MSDYEGAAFPKGTRKRNRKLLAEIKKRPCLVCSMGPCDPHHLVTRKAGGDDSENNIVPLCRSCHTEIHSIGIYSFAEKHASLRRWFQKWGWSLDELHKKWRLD